MSQTKIKKAIIPVAGYGSRLFPATITTSKTLFPIGNKPILHYILEECMFAEIKELIFIISPDQMDVMNYLTLTKTNKLLKKFPNSKELLEHKNLIKYFTKISFVIQQKPSGLGDAVLLGSPYIDYDEAFAVILGDNPIVENTMLGISELIKYWTKDEFSNVIGIKQVPLEDTHKYGIVEFDVTEENWVSSVEEKPNTPKSNKAIIGRYIFQYNIFKYLRDVKKSYKEEGIKKELDLTGAINLACFTDLNVYGIELRGVVEDTGNVKGYNAAIIKYLTK